MSISSADPSEISSNDLLFKVHYPDETTGEAYNRQGELTYLRDENTTEHEYTRDALGRVTLDAVVTATGVDDFIKSIGTTYDDLGRVEEVISYTATTEANGVRFGYNGIWQITQIDQDHLSAVTLDGSGNPTGETKRVTYSYDTKDVASGNYSRVNNLVYPDGWNVQHAYGPGSASNSKISRLTGMGQFPLGNSPAANYSYIGHSMVAVVDYAQPDVQLDRGAAHNGQRDTGTYPGFDQYGRVKRQMWVDGNFTTHASSGAVPNVPQVVEQLYTYDNASSRTGAFDARPGVSLPLSHRYEYDGLHRLKEARRGVWNGSEDPDLADATHTLNSQQWELDLLGNWDTVSTETSGNGQFDTAEQEGRTHNDVNKLLDRTMPGGSPTLSLDYDLAGNLTGEETGNGTTSLVYTHDAWDRLVRSSSTTPFTSIRARNTSSTASTGGR